VEAAYNGSHRLFFALCPPVRVRAAIDRFLRQNPARHARPVPVANWHMTLLFIGPVSTPVCERLARWPFPQSPAFDLILDRCGHWSCPQVGWLAPSHSPPALLALRQQVATAVTAVGLKTETRPYRPHVTVWRKLRQPWHCQHPPDILWPVSRWHLVRSVSCSGGVRYESVACWPLAQRP